MTQQDQVGSAEIRQEQPESGRPQRRFDAGFSRNVKIVGAVAAIAIVVTAVVLYRSQAALQSARDKGVPATVIGSAASEKSAAAPQATQAEMERTQRVHQNQADMARNDGSTYIPKDLPLVGVPAGAPTRPEVGQGPGRGYNPNTGHHTGAEDARNEQARLAGVERQLTSLMKVLEPGVTSSAGPYEDKHDKRAAQTQTAGQPVQTQPSTASSATTASAVVKDLLAGLSIHGASLIAPLDTARAAEVLARIDSGPAAGAMLFGRGVVVGDDGVRLTFSKMSLSGKTYDINAVGLDAQTSSTAMQADIDRKLFARYVIPILGTVGKAYADAVARPGQQLVVEGGTVNVVTPTASARQAAAAGVGAGLGRITQAATYDGPNTAYMPAGVSIGIIFLDPVKTTVATK